MKILSPWLSFTISLVVFVALFWGAYSQLDWDAVYKTLTALAPISIICAVLMMWCNFIVASLRLHQVMDVCFDSPPEFKELFKLNLLSAFAAHAAPVGPAADFARFAYGKWRLHMASSPLAQSIFMDRLLAFLGLAIVGLLLLPLQILVGANSGILLSQLVIWSVCIAGFSLILIFKMHLTKDHRSSILKWAASFLEVTQRLVSNPRCLVIQFIIALGYSISFSLLFYLLADAMGLTASFLVFLAFGPIVLLAQSLPIFYAGWGGREAAAVATLGSLDVIEPHQILSVSIAAGIVFFLASVPGSLFLWQYRRKSNDGPFSFDAEK